MRRVWKRVGGAAGCGQLFAIGLVLGLVGISMSLNFQYVLLAVSGEMRWLYAYGLLLLDGFKAVVLLFVVRALSPTVTVFGVCQAVSGLAIWIAAVGFSLSCGIGLYMIAEDARQGGISASKAQHIELKSERDRLQSEITVLGQVAVRESVEAELRALRHSTVWTRTNECTDATIAVSRDFCANVARLVGEWETAIERGHRDSRVATLRGELAQVRQALAAIDLRQVYATSDVAVRPLATVFGVETATVRSVLAILIGGLIEATAALGLFIVASSSRSSARERELVNDVSAMRSRGDGVNEWVKAMIARKSGSSVRARDLYDRYVDWAETYGFSPASQSALGRRLSERGYVRKKKRAGVCYADIELREV